MALTDMPEVAWCVRLQCGDGVSLQLRPARAGRPVHLNHSRTGRRSRRRPNSPNAQRLIFHCTTVENPSASELYSLKVSLPSFASRYPSRPAHLWLSSEALFTKLVCGESGGGAVVMVRTHATQKTQGRPVAVARVDPATHECAGSIYVPFWRICSKSRTECKNNSRAILSPWRHFPCRCPSLSRC